ncbi:hypothetical protein LCGC14_2935430 [marine sediment metagenome]|uniref:Uncharacterized protein n=1 Tax=marine sediment metagenome TaxID=412755 RepID=A0A0F8Y6P0_9ZZZZ
MATTSSFKMRRPTYELSSTLTYSDTTATKVFSLPDGVRIVDWIVNVVTAFSGGSTHTIDVGSTSASGDEFLDGVTVATAGKVTLTTHVQLAGRVTTAITDVYMSVADGTAGEVRVTCLFSHEKGRLS